MRHLVLIMLCRSSNTLRGEQVCTGHQLLVVALRQQVRADKLTSVGAALPLVLLTEPVAGQLPRGFQHRCNAWQPITSLSLEQREGHVQHGLFEGTTAQRALHAV